MKKSLITLASIFAITAASADFYGAIGVGTNPYSRIRTHDIYGNNMKSKNDLGYAYSIAAGYEIPIIRIRAELEYLNISASSEDNADVRMNSNGTFANVLWKMPVPIVAPYIGAGIGYMDLAAHDQPTSVYMQKGFSFQAIVGGEITVPIIKTIGLEARYLHSKSGSGEERDITDNILLMAKVRF